MKYISALAVLLLVMITATPALAVLRYVDASTGSNANTGEDTARWATISYATATIPGGTSSDHDTIFVYGYPIDGTDSMYSEYVDLSTVDKYVDLVGISVGTDSPWFTQLNGTERIFADSPIVIDGIRFVNCYVDPPVIRIGGMSSFTDHNVVRNCLFDSEIVKPKQFYAGGAITAYPTNGSSCVLDIDNSAFVSWGYDAPVVMARVQDAPTANSVNMTNTTFRNCISAVRVNYGNDGSMDSVSVTIKDSVLDCSSVLTMWGFSSNVNPKTDTLNITYCDTFGNDTWISFEFNSIVCDTVVLIADNNINVNPAFTNDDVADTAYALSKYTNTTVGTASSSSGPLGPSWSYTAAAAAVTRRNSFFMTRWARILGIGL